MLHMLCRIILSRQTGFLLCVLAALLGIAIFVGLAPDIGSLENIPPDFISVKPDTGILLMLSSISMALLLQANQEKKYRFSTITIALLILLTASLTLCQEIFGWDFGIKQWVLKDISTTGMTISSGIGANSACCFILFALTFILESQSTLLNFRLPFLFTASTTIITISTAILLNSLSIIIFHVVF